MEDKENTPLHKNVMPTLALDKVPDVIKTLKSRSTFGKLLKEVKNEILIEQDERLALRTHVEEAVNLACELVREESGHPSTLSLVFLFKLLRYNNRSFTG